MEHFLLWSGRNERGEHFRWNDPPSSILKTRKDKNPLSCTTVVPRLLLNIKKKEKELFYLFNVTLLLFFCDPFCKKKKERKKKKNRNEHFQLAKFFVCWCESLPFFFFFFYSSAVLIERYLLLFVGEFFTASEISFEKSPILFFLHACVSKLSLGK